jgi:hypothetical protein
MEEQCREKIITQKLKSKAILEDALVTAKA